MYFFYLSSLEFSGFFQFMGVYIYFVKFPGYYSIVVTLGYFYFFLISEIIIE